MSPSHVLEPTYDGIKRRLMIGHWPSGSRLEAARLAADLGVSITPVRDSLNHLAGERLVDMIPGEGFRVPSPTEQDLRDLLDFNLFILLAVIDADTTPWAMPARVERDHAFAIASLFLAIAGHSDNGEIPAAVQSLSERMHPFRRLDEDLLPEAATELDELWASFSEGRSGSDARNLLIRYHSVRKREAGRYVRRCEGR